MAASHRINGTTVKTRNPLAPVFLPIITFGIYILYWYYEINRELRDTGEDVSPGLALVAVTLGAVLIVPPIVSLYNTADRIRRTQVRAGVTSPIIPILTLLAMLVPILHIFVPAYAQLSLNSAWDGLRRQLGQ